MCYFFPHHSGLFYWVLIQACDWIKCPNFNEANHKRVVIIKPLDTPKETISFLIYNTYCTNALTIF